MLDENNAPDGEPMRNVLSGLREDIRHTVKDSPQVRAMRADFVEVYAARWEAGQDIFTGDPLTGDDLREWKKWKASPKSS